MDYGAIDLHTRHSQIRIVDGGRRRSCSSDGSRRRGTALRAGVRGAAGRCGCWSRAGPESEWVAQTIEALRPRGDRGGSPNYALMYGAARSRR